MSRRQSIIGPAESRRQALGRRRRGSVYLLVLGVAVILTVIGLGAVAVSRVNIRSASQSQDWSEAQSLAFSGAEHAMAMVNSTTAWRTVYSGTTVSKFLGRGTFTWQLTDVTGNGLSSSSTTPFLIKATGAVGRACYSVQTQCTTSSSSAVSYGAMASGAITLNSSSTIDSYDSSLGAYGGSNVGSQAAAATNSTSASTVSLSSFSDIKGSVNVGQGGDPSTAVSKDDSSAITGTVTSLSAPLAMPTPAAPSGMGSSTGSFSVSHDSTSTISGNMHLSSLTVVSNATLKIRGAVTLLVDGDVTVSSNASLQVLANSSLKLYFSGRMNIMSNANAVVSGQNLSRLQLINLGSNSVMIFGNGTVQGVIISPNGNVLLFSDAQVCGAVIGKSISLNSIAAIHQDVRITNHVDNVALPGGTSKPVPVSWTRIVH